MKRALVAALAVCLVTAGCGSGNTGGDSQELTYWSMWKPGEDQQKVLQAAIEEFEKSSGISVKVQWSGRDVLKQVAARMTVGDPPDLTDQDAGALQGNLNKSDGLMGLSDVYDATIEGETKTVKEVISPALVRSYQTKGGQPFVVPYEVIGSTIWYNAATHPELVTNPPKSWTEFIAVLDALKAKGRTPIALDGDIKFYDAYWTTWSIIRHGGIGLLPKAATDPTGATFDDPAFLKAAKDIEQLIKGGYLVKGFNGTKWPAQQNAWAAGKSPTDLLLMGTWAPSETGPQAAQGFQHRSFPFPAVEGGKGNQAAEAGVIGFAIPSKARNAAAAKKFIAFFLNKDRLAKIATDAKNLTPREDVPAPTELADYQKEVASAGTHLFLPYDDASALAPDWATNVWEPANADFFNGKLDAAGFVARLKDETIKLGKR